MNDITKNIKTLAASLLRKGQVDMVLGFKSGSVPMACAPFMARLSEQADLFVWNHHCGPSLAMALDEKKEDDALFTHGGVEYLMEKSLLEKASPVTVDYAGMGFNLSSSLELSSGCGSCGSTGSCCE